MKLFQRIIGHVDMGHSEARKLVHTMKRQLGSAAAERAPLGR